MKKRSTRVSHLSPRLLTAGVMTAAMLAAPGSAHAAATITGGPYTGLNPDGATITLTITNPPTTAGMYVQQCQITQGTRPSVTQCNAPAQLWITNSGQGNFRFSDTITINVRESFGTISCNAVGCGLFFRLDHTAPTNTSEDRFIPIQFTGGSTVVLPNDEITVKVGGVDLVAQRPTGLAYRTPITLTATARSGSAITAKALGTNCSVDAALVVTALKGTGECVIAVTSAGNASYAGNTANFPFLLKPGIQTLALEIPSVAKVSKAIGLASSTLTTSMGEKIKMVAKPASACTITVAKKSYTLKAKKPGACVITVSAAGRTDLYAPFKTSVTVNVTR